MDWQSLGETPYKKWHVYQMCWPLDTVQSVISGAPNGGPLALRSLTKARDFDEVLQTVDTYTTSGLHLASIPCKASIAGVSWTVEENLVIVDEHGCVNLYDMFGNLQNSFAMLSTIGASDQTIKHVVVWNVGLVVLTNHMVLAACDDTNRQSPKVYSMETGLSPLQRIIAMTVLQPRFTSTGLLEVIVSTHDNSIVVVDVHGPEDQLLQDRFQAPIVAMAAAPNGRFVACFTTSGILTVLSASFTTKVLDFDTATSQQPLDMQWCGEDSVLLQWSHFILMIGPYGHWLKFSCPAPKHIIPEIDCCRMISTTSCELLQRVPSQIELIHRIGSTDLAAMLYDAVEALEDGDPKADDHIRSVASSEQIALAIRTNVSAAIAEMTPRQQMKYMQTAAYGKNFCQVGDFCASAFVAAAREMRVLNHLRLPDPGICITSKQYSVLGSRTLIARLLIRQQYALAMSISEYLALDQCDILIHWACAQCSRSRSTADCLLTDLIRTRFHPYECCIPYVQVALAAHNASRQALARALIESGVAMHEQVEVLLALAEHALAVRKALETCEVDIILFAISGKPNHDKCSGVDKSEMEQLVFPEVRQSAFDDADVYALSIRYHKWHAGCKYHSERLHLLLSTYSGGASLGINIVEEGYRDGKLESQFRALHDALRLFDNTKGAYFQHKVTEDQIHLLSMQTEYEHRFGVSCFVGMSVTETLYNLVALGSSQLETASSLQLEAFKMQRRFKIPDRRFYYVKIRALAASGKVELVQSFAMERKSPVGYKPFIDACIQHNYPTREVAKLVNRLSSPEEKVDYYVQLRLWDQAIDLAIRLRDPNVLCRVQDLCSDAKVVALCEEYKSRLH
eukprot:CAMPEP_0185720820 /NCGR_PEP_ID=MMETSP1164-20130828/50307_1 /TAXON_ID=1104430 /ORGANISM="Chrysoreinhardia sp, Strain CCMP2950" /LENGTH=852 /DNA_ID=CAMNT_0028388481 /DNA_START=177 /DNA_END=2735 /DNA_ORIENTATION=+